MKQQAQMRHPRVCINKRADTIGSTVLDRNGPEDEDLS